jgi:hypothetical protein
MRERPVGLKFRFCRLIPFPVGIRIFLAIDLNDPDLIGPAASDIKITLWSRHHISNYAAPGGYRPSGKFLLPGIKPYDRIWAKARFAIPHRAVRGQALVIK